MVSVGFPLPSKKNYVTHSLSKVGSLLQRTLMWYSLGQINLVGAGL